jgi:hypothetical protein
VSDERARRPSDLWPHDRPPRRSGGDGDPAQAPGHRAGPARLRRPHHPGRPGDRRPHRHRLADHGAGHLRPVVHRAVDRRAPRRPQVGALRRPAAAAGGRAAHRPRAVLHPPARPGRPAGGQHGQPGGRPRPAGVGHAGPRPVRGRAPGAARPPAAVPVRLHAGPDRPGAAGHPGAAAGLAVGGQRRQDLDPGGRLQHPARRVRQDLPDRLLRRLPGRQTRRPGAGQPPRHGPGAAARPRPRPGAGGLGAVDPGAGLRARPGQLAAAVRHLRGDAVRGHRAGQLAGHRPGPVRRRRAHRLPAVRPRPAARRLLARPVRVLRRLGLPGGAGAVRPGHRRAVRGRPRRRPSRPGAGGQERLHRRRRRRGAGAVRPGRGDHRLPGAGRARPAHLADRPRRLRQAAGRRPGLRDRLAGVRRPRRGHRTAAADRPHHAVPRLRRLVAGGQLRAGRRPGADQ